MAQTTGIDFPYEPPENPQLRLDATLAFAQKAADSIIGFMKIRAWLPVTARAFALNKAGQFTGFAPVDVAAEAA